MVNWFNVSINRFCRVDNSTEHELNFQSPMYNTPFEPLELCSTFCSPFQGKGLGSGHKTLLYGNAILLRHCNSDMVTFSNYTLVKKFWIDVHLWFTQYLACLSSSSSNDKLAFDVGLQEQSEGEWPKIFHMLRDITTSLHFQNNSTVQFIQYIALIAFRRGKAQTVLFYFKIVNSD